MAESKKEKKELTVEEKLKALYKLQTVNSEIDKIKTLRGELPLEVQDLEDEIVGLNTRIANFKAEIAQNETNISGKKSEIEIAKGAVEKYTEQQNNVRNNREYDNLSKEIEYKNLEIELSEKRIREYTAAVKSKTEEIAKLKEYLDGHQIDLKQKKQELAEIVSETKQEDRKIQKDEEQGQSKHRRRDLIQQHGEPRGAAAPKSRWAVLLELVLSGRGCNSRPEARTKDRCSYHKCTFPY